MTMTEAASVLEIDLDASKDDIKRAYKIKARRFHPDNKVGFSFF